MILIIRGHIRNAFKTQNLYNLIEMLYNIFPELNIFIHTWNIFSNNISWREIPINGEIVSEDIICNYFGKLNNCIKHIIIEDDKNIRLHGNLEGTINNGPMPIIGWKNYWYGKYKIINYIFNNFKYHDRIVVNTRFDILDNSNNFSGKTIIDFIKNNSGKKLIKNVFLFNDEVNGIDNIYIGNIYTMYRLTNSFFYNLDDILIKHNDTINQERLVYRINSIMFD